MDGSDSSMKPFLKRALMALIIFPPMVALTNYDPSAKSARAEHAVKAKVFPVKSPRTVSLTENVPAFRPDLSLLNDRCTGI